MSATVTIRCYAKINLGLKVLGLRPDGYHEIRSILHTITLHDTLVARRSKKTTLEIEEAWIAGEGGPVPLGPENLVLKSHSALKEVLGRRGVAFTLTKRVPPGSGLGAASSDAASALIAVDRLYGLALGPAALHRAAASIGSDVPFFLYGGACLALGRGEEIFPLPDARAFHLAAVFPAGGLSTPEVYSRWDRLLTSPDKVSRMNDFAPWGLVCKGEAPAVANDLERAAIDLDASLEGTRSALREAGATAVSMSGSGSVFYGMFPDAERAEEAVRLLRKKGHAAVAAKTLGRSEWEQAVRSPA